MTWWNVTTSTGDIVVTRADGAGDAAGVALTSMLTDYYRGLRVGRMPGPPPPWREWENRSWRSGIEGARKGTWEVWGNRGGASDPWEELASWTEDSVGMCTNPGMPPDRIAQVVANAAAVVEAMGPDPMNTVVVFEGLIVNAHAKRKATDLCECGHPEPLHEEGWRCRVPYCGCRRFDLAEEVEP